jgi:hypothetical protein
MGRFAGVIKLAGGICVGRISLAGRPRGVRGRSVWVDGRLHAVGRWRDVRVLGSRE